MEKVHLNLGANSYDIVIGPGLLHDSRLLASQIAGEQVFVVSNRTVADLYMTPLTNALEGFQVDIHLMPDGEEYKTLGTLEEIAGSLLAAGHNRSTTIVALGGGVVGDTAGFVAASYQRGVAFVQLPTTLLSQVDSSVGGKTAVNHKLGKNMLGAFHQPKAVLIDTDTLASLPPREFSAGLAEVIKHGVLADAAYFAFVEEELDAIKALEPGCLTATIKGSCEIKSAIVAADEKESGQRALLNFGHTFGHAIETGMGHGEWLHGEAVGAGMVMAADLSLRLGRCKPEDAARIKTLVGRAGLPVVPPGLNTKNFLHLMSRDKKVVNSGPRFVLLDGGIGKSELVADVPVEAVKQTLAAGEALCEDDK